MQFANEFLVNTETDASQEAACIAFTTGRYCIAWRSRDAGGPTIRLRLFGLDDQASGDEVIVYADVLMVPGSPKVAALANGDFVVVWPAEDGDDTFPILSRLFDPSGNARGPAEVVPHGSGRPSLGDVIGLSDGGYLVSWSVIEMDQPSLPVSIGATIFDRAGAQGVLMDVTEPAPLGRSAPRIAELADGALFFAWDRLKRVVDPTHARIEGRIMERSGGARSDILEVSQAERGIKSQVSTAVMKSGDVMTVWGYDSSAQDQDGIAIMARILAPNGTGRGDEWQVNSMTSGPQVAPAICVLDDGMVAMTWTTGDPAQDGSKAAIIVRGYDPTGQRSPGEFRFNQLALGEQERSVIAPLENGRFVVAWQSMDGAHDDSGWGIKARSGAF